MQIQQNSQNPQILRKNICEMVQICVSFRFDLLAEMSASLFGFADIGQFACLSTFDLTFTSCKIWKKSVPLHAEKWNVYLVRYIKQNKSDNKTRIRIWKEQEI